MHDVQPYSSSVFNTTHIIRHLSFGTDIKSANTAPLDGITGLAKEGKHKVINFHIHDRIRELVMFWKPINGIPGGSVGSDPICGAEGSIDFQSPPTSVWMYLFVSRVSVFLYILVYYSVYISKLSIVILSP